jgi:hypothetical protein
VSSANKRRGSGWERAIVEHLRPNGFPHAERRLAGSATDRGDIAGIPGVVIEAKNQARHSLAEWLDEATREASNDRADLGVVWAKRRGIASAGRGYVVMEGDAFIALLRWAGYGNPIDKEAS